MWCPVCGAEYRAGFTRCANHGVDLVEEAPSELMPEPQPARSTSCATEDLVARSIGQQFESFKAFYNDEPRRRGDDVQLTDVVDDQYRWSICWLSGTGEVAAFVSGWAHEAEHWKTRMQGGHFDLPHVGQSLEQPPQLVRVLACLPSLTAAESRISNAAGESLAAIGEHLSSG